MTELILEHFSQKTNLDTEIVKSTKLPEKNLLKVQILLCSIHKNFADSFWRKIIYALKFRLNSQNAALRNLLQNFHQVSQWVCLKVD